MPEHRHPPERPRVLPFGEAAVLAEVDSLADVLALHARLAGSRLEGVVDLVPAARTVLVVVDPAVLPLTVVRAWIAGTSGAPEVPLDPKILLLPIVYDGEDLAAVAEDLELSVDELIRRHSAAEWTVAFTGFAPGFGYLVSAEWPFRVSRRSSPRTRLPAGAVGLAGEFTGAYPRATPGGWQLIGTTSASLFDPDAAPPALLAPGSRVRFVPVAATSPAAALPRDVSEAGSIDPDRVVAADVVASGLLSTRQDEGRPGHLAEGISASGAADRGALRTANRLVGNDESAAGIEITMGGLRLRARRDLWVAVTGAWGPIRIAGREVGPYDAQPWPAGTELEIDWFTHGARGYLAIRGGLGGPLVAGSRATDLLAGLGSAPLAEGDELTLADAGSAGIPPLAVHPWGPPDDTLVAVDLAPGPRADWFTPAAHAALFDATWTVSHAADRIGIRLDGPVLDRIRTGELPSEGMLPGAVQVPPDGRPVILGPDAPVTGGYPVIAVVTDRTRDLLAQARPGSRILFRHAR
ncbi:5-oxoprolinase subunit B/C family protein [Microbacterium memoriense]|uniref:Urea amidolyase family protein n=1 Tax=Microbacterium memoriense TaxID=2978350 RepID=A0ABT2PBD6_9MICO|nr:urea amidolyase family protein [Microbacterium memoriense]MCT9001795.1 urea amidolyase family protein [Microbacterium memoriense]